MNRICDILTIIKVSEVLELRRIEAALTLLIVSIFSLLIFPNSSYASPCAPITKAMTGDADAQNMLGLDYLKGEDGCIRNYTEGIRWLKKAERNGDPDAKDNLCWAYSGGQVLSLSPEKVFVNTLPVNKRGQKIWCRP